MGIDRFWSKVKKSDGCWIWQGRTTDQGYGLFFYGQTWLTHRLSWFITHRCIPLGMCVLHKCDVPSCVNPAHLFLGTRLDNMKDMKSKGRKNGNNGSVCGVRQGLHKLTDRQVQSIREQYRNGVSQHQLAKIYKVSQPTIFEAVHFRTWKHVAS